ncbi:hypothetical protein [Alicyclobacillus sp. ALC3]|uniref:hypothetical protein n=1 Tax=Alicyclobacillus sp. ALC3 TaxID=2796143 RepID=UPI002379D9BA|nr:hypothetical protein [Alicyclobacillus sp. ALC3]WDL98201.1 hypothetical protein JC200_05740 [Alicyclobacillus sp. ALC3]
MQYRGGRPRAAAWQYGSVEHAAAGLVWKLRWGRTVPERTVPERTVRGRTVRRAVRRDLDMGWGLNHTGVANRCGVAWSRPWAMGRGRWAVGK